VPWLARCRETFFRPSSTVAHLNVVLCDPVDLSAHGYSTKAVIVVGVFSLRQTWHDSTVLLNLGEHRFIQQTSYIDFSRAEIRPALTFERLVNQGGFRTHDPVTAPLLARILQGISTSPRTPRDVKACARSLP
jgi:hypothetical protein